MKKIGLLALIMCSLFPLCLRGQITLMVTCPDELKQDIYVSGTFDNWSGGRPEYKLIPDDKGYFLRLSPRQGKLEFKFTRGSWDQVEGTADGRERGNREYNYLGGTDTLWLKIEGWKDPSKAPMSTANEQVVILDEHLSMPQLKDRKRGLRLYLPKNYHHSSRRYPVLYMHDAQSLFDRSTASYGTEWMVDEVLDSLTRHKGLEIIVVGVDNGGQKRIDEYSPWVNEEYGGGEGLAYAEFLIHTLKPYIDSHYRTLKDASNTGMMGSSMGGLITHVLGVEYPDVFGKVAVFSPSYWFADQVFEFTASKPGHPDSKWVMMAGDAESESMVSDMLRMTELLHEQGWNENHFLIHVERGGQHNERTWQNLVAPSVLWMFEE